jgi:hypothetical protein
LVRRSKPDFSQFLAIWTIALTMFGAVVLTR